MSNLEHYFENLLFDGKDCRGDVNKNTLTKEEQEAVEICAQYVIWSIFDGREEVKNFIKQEFEPIKHGRWLRTDAYPHRIYCSECYATFIRNDEFLKLNDIPHGYCPNCGAKMDGQNDE